MGYNISRHAVLRNKPQLQLMLDSQSTVKFPSDNPNKLAYKIREALASAEELAEFPEYSELKRDFIVKVIGSEVVAEFQGVGGEGGQVVSQTLATGPEKKTIVEAFTIVDAIGAALQFSTTQELFFPNLVLTEEEREKVYTWSQSEDWTYLDHAEGGITLTKKEVPEEIVWSPPTQIEEEN